MPAWAAPVWPLYVVRTPERDAVQRSLKAAGVDTLIHYPIPPHRQQAYASLGWGEGAFPVSERIHREVLSLPVGPQMTDEQQDRVIEAIAAHFARRGAAA